MNKKTSRPFVSAVCFALLAIGATTGCRRAPSAARATEVSTPSAAPKLSRIVFVGKEHACDCTRKSVDAGWAALQRALGPGSKIPVERMNVDTEPTRVDPYRSQKPIMALPAIYFVDGKGSVLDLLQGEVGEAQVQPILEKAR